MSLARSTASGAKWSIASVAGRHLVLVTTTIVLARLLSPTDFGLVAMASVFTRFIEVLRDMGTGAGIVQVEGVSDEFLSSMFWLNAGLGAIASAALLIAAPVAAAIFREARLPPLIRVLSVVPMFAGLGVVQTSLLTRSLDFRRIALVELVGAAAGGIVAVTLAFGGYGAWSLVWQSLSSAFAVSAGMWFATNWRPRAVFERGAVRSIAGFSINLTGFNVLNYCVRYADNLLIGRYLGASSLGIYDLAYRLMLAPLQYVSAAIHRTLFPVYTRIRADRERLRRAYLKVANGVAIIAFPIMFGLAAVSSPLIATVFGPAWSLVAPLLLIFGPLGALQAIAGTSWNIYQSTGRTDLMFIWGAGSGPVTVAAFVVGLQWGVVGVAAAYAIVSTALAYLQFKIPLGLIDLPIAALAEALARPLLCGLCMLAAVLLVRIALADRLGEAVSLGVLVSIGALVYTLATWVFNRESASEVLALAGKSASN